MSMKNCNYRFWCLAGLPVWKTESKCHSRSDCTVVDDLQFLRLYMNIIRMCNIIEGRYEANQKLKKVSTSPPPL